MSEITRAIDYMIDLKVRAIDVWLEETIEPLIKETKALENRIFEKAYKEVLEMEKKLEGK